MQLSWFKHVRELRLDGYASTAGSWHKATSLLVHTQASLGLAQVQKKTQPMAGFI
ncbi:MAG: hypothetical protein JSR39_03260 [Verrucomicrobia bacterium]|nr:hypothetical protein [Verrucomicrobiota bacterium]